MGFGPGGLGDIAGRAIGEVMSKSIGQPVIIENMPGAGGATAALAVARAAPDGHSMLWVSSQNAIAPSMFKALPYDWSRDFTPIGPMATFDFVLFVHKDSPLKTVARRDRGGQEKSGQVQLRLDRGRHRAESLDLEFRVDGGPQRADGAVPHHRRGGDRAPVRQHPGGVRDHSGRDRPDPGRQLAGDRGVVQQARAVPAGCADHRRKRRAELLDLFLERHGAAGQDAARTS